MWGSRGHPGVPDVSEVLGHVDLLVGDGDVAELEQR